jgi:hypothetical protein
MAEQQEAPITPKGRTSRQRYAPIAPLYKALIWTSFLINAILLIVVGVLAGIVLTQRSQLIGIVGNTQGFAGNTIAELQDVIAKLESSTIIYTVPLDTRLPIEIDVPIDQTTVVTLTEPVPLDVPASIIFPGVGNLAASNVRITLPANLRLPIALNFSVPLRTSVPVVLDVPVRIPLAETELGPQFQRLGAIVDRLVSPIDPLLVRPDVPPDSSLLRPSSTPEMPAPVAPEPDPNAPPTVTPGNPSP